MNAAVTAAFYNLAAAILFIGGVIVLGLGAWIWARAQADVFRTKSHRISAAAQQDAVEAAEDALDEIHDRRDEYRMPTDAELREAARAGVEDEQLVRQGDITTMGNEGEEWDRSDQGIAPGGFYQHEDDVA